MAVTLFGAFVIFIVPVVSLNLEPPEFLGPYTDDPARWPYGGCVQVSRIYPAPGSLLLPPLDPYAKDWNLTITVVFSRPVTRILWNYDIRVWLRNVALSNDSKWSGQLLTIEHFREGLSLSKSSSTSWLPLAIRPYCLWAMPLQTGLSGSSY